MCPTRLPTANTYPPGRASYDHTNQNGPSNVIPVDVWINAALQPTPGISKVNTLTTGAFDQDVFLLSPHFGL